MIRNYLKEAVVDAPHGMFVKVLPTFKSIGTIKGNTWELESIQPLVDDPHCTVIYSKTDAKQITIPKIERNARYQADIKECVYWPGADKEGYIVILLESESLQALHKQFRDAGLEPTFPDYKPHVTLLHPVGALDADKERYIRYTNQMIKNRHPELTFYYGGYTIMDEK